MHAILVDLGTRHNPPAHLDGQVVLFHGHAAKKLIEKRLHCLFYDTKCSDIKMGKNFYRLVLNKMASKDSTCVPVYIVTNEAIGSIVEGVYLSFDEAANACRSYFVLTATRAKRM
jgi:hypothetical protein